MINHLSGCFNYGPCKEVEASLTLAQESETPNIIIKLLSVPFVASAKIGLTTLIHRTLRITSMTLALVNPHGCEVFKLGNLPMLMAVFQLVDEATQASVSV